MTGCVSQTSPEKRNQEKIEIYRYGCGYNYRYVKRDLLEKLAQVVREAEKFPSLAICRLETRESQDCGGSVQVKRPQNTKTVLGR